MDNQSQNQSQGNLAAQQALCPDPAGCLREGCNQNRDGSPCEFCPGEFFVESEQPNTDTDKGHQAAPQTGDVHGSMGRGAERRDESYAIRVPTGGGAVMAMVNPWAEPHMEWMLRYGSDLNAPDAGRFVAAEIVASYDYLLSGEITLKEATRRLTVLRKARALALCAGKRQSLRQSQV